MKKYNYKNLTPELIDKIFKEFKEKNKDEPKWIVWDDLNPPILETMVDAILRIELEELRYNYALWGPPITTKTVNGEPIIILDYPDRL